MQAAGRPRAARKGAGRGRGRAGGGAPHAVPGGLQGQRGCRRGARRCLTWSQCPSLAESCGRTLFIRLGGNLGEPCVQLAYRERRGDCRRGGTWLLAARLILSRQDPFAGPEDRHEPRLRKAVTTASASRLPGGGSLALSLSRPFARLRVPPPSLPAPDQFAAVGPGSEAASEWRGKSKCAAVSGRGAAGAGLRGGRDLPATGENEWGSGCRGAGGAEPGAGVYSEECFVHL